MAGLLFFSGMCALIYQVTWFREFRLVFGASTAASSAVLAVFMGGLGLGNALLGKRADRIKSPIAWYAVLELAIALTAAASPWLIDPLHRLYLAVGGQLGLGFLGATAVRLALAALVLGLPTFFMGGSLPAGVRAVTGGEDHERSGAAILYGLNTLGAVVGALGSTFFTLDYFGTRTTLWLACFINLATAFSALVVSRSVHRSAPAAPQPLIRKLPKPNSFRKNESISPYLIYGLAAIAGFAFFLMELVWYRMLGPILGGTTFTFGLILAVALSGIGLGAAAYAIIFRRMMLSLHGLALINVLEAFAIAVPFALGDHLALLAATFREAHSAHFLSQVVNWSMVAAIVILPASLVSGLQFSLLIGLLGEGEQDVGKHVGLACCCNTVGAIAGSLAGGFGLLPLLSAPGVWRSVVALLVVVSLSILICAWRKTKRRAWAVATAGTIILTIFLISDSGPTPFWRHGAVAAGRDARLRALTNPNEVRDWQNEVRRSVLWEADGVESSVAIVGADGLAFHLNGMCDGNAIKDAGTQIMLGLIGAALHPRPESAIVVGLGTGETAGWLAAVPSIQHVDVVELEPAVSEMALRCRQVNRDVLNNSKVQLIFNDAREVLRTTGDCYDLIICEPSNPYRNGIANLFTREFYVAGHDRLNDKGMFVQWLQAYEIDQSTLRTVLATFQSVFTYVEIWQSKPGDLVLVGSDARRAYPVAEMRKTLSVEPFASALLCAWHTADLEGMFSHYVGATALAADFVGEDAPFVNTDDHNVIEYGCARTLGRAEWDGAGELYSRSIAIGDHKPVVEGGSVDWNAVALGRQWDAVVRGGKKLSASHLASISEGDGKILERFEAKDARGVLSAWESLPHSAPCLTELAVIAHLYAEAGNSKAESLIEQLRHNLPTEAEALHGILAYRQRNSRNAAERLTIALRRMRTDPWILDHVCAKALNAAIGVVKADHGQASVVLQALREPFAAYNADECRRASACVVAEALGPAAVVPFVESFEPHVPWSEQYLTYRQHAYQAAGHSLAAQADRDLQEFHRRTTNSLSSRQ
jgi:predicted membrane-bound spermidine synthase